MKSRSIVIVFVFVWVFLVTGGRLAWLCLGEDTTAASATHSLYTVTVDSPRGTVWDRNHLPLTNRQTVYQTVLTATPQVISRLHETFPSPQKQQLLQQLAARKPVTLTTRHPFLAGGATSLPCCDRVPFSQPAVHLIGYLNPAGETGLWGIQKAFDSQLAGSQTTTVTYACDATGGALPGVSPEISQAPAPKNGVITTLDSHLQQVAQEVFPSLKKGALVIQKAGSGQLLALVSGPDYSPKDIEGAMNHPQLPLLTRYCTAYNVGSVFKLCVAAAALEAGVSPLRQYTCTGSLDCGVTFSCHQKEGHGTLTMEQAMAVSCNTYFMDLALQIGGQPILDMAQALGLGQSISLFDGMESEAGQLPAAAALAQSPGEVCNFAIGQGVFMATPLQLCAMTAAIAAGGIYFPPYCIAGVTDRAGNTAHQKATAGRRVFSTQTAQALTAMMELVMTQGTGTAGAIPSITAAGKTATAQTGMVDENKKPITQAWFTGFYPTQSPQYVVTVLVEEGSSGGGDAAPIFGNLCKKLNP